MKMTRDADCTRAGWTEALITLRYYDRVSLAYRDLHISHAPDADLGERFAAFCHDEQEMVVINGWMIEDYQIVLTTH